MTEEVLKEWVFAAGFREWVEEQAPDWRIVLADSQRRRVQAMQKEHQERVSLPVIDKICCQLGLHINEVPEHLWTDAPRRSGKSHPPELRAAAVRAVKRGETVTEIAERLGIARQTVSHWRDAA